MKLFKLENPIQDYSWGSVDGLGACLGLPNPEGRPQAEMWMGAHPKAPSILEDGGRRVRLDDYIQEAPESCLGPEALARFGRGLPFLFKALSAARPLSIQAHPSKKKAERGFERESLAGIPIDAADRSYRDRNHKPEMVVALTPFEGLFGFRPIGEIVENIKLISPRDSERLVGRLARNPGRVELSVFFYSLISADPVAKADMLADAAPVIEALLESGAVPEGRREAFRWTRRLRELYPGDIGVLAPLLLNHVVLQPGESLYVGAGELHAYLKGESLELMANSDNVIRGGLTEKHVDVPELVSVLTFDSGRALPFRAEPVSESEELYPCLAPDFRLSRITVQGGKVERAVSSPEILLCVEGSVSLSDGPGSLEIGRGGAAFVRADAKGYAIGGNGVVYRAFLPGTSELPPDGQA